MLHKILILTLVFITSSMLVKAQDSAYSDQQRVQNAVIKWADSTLESYKEPHFKNFTANFTDEYLMKKMRTDAINKSIQRVKKAYNDSTDKGSDAAYKKSLYDLELRKQEALKVEENFHPKVTSYTIHFWSSVLLDTDNYADVAFKITLDDYYEVIKHKEISTAGAIKKGNVLLR